MTFLEVFQQFQRRNVVCSHQIFAMNWTQRRCSFLGFHLTVFSSMLVLFWWLHFWWHFLFPSVLSYLLLHVHVITSYTLWSISYVFGHGLFTDVVTCNTTLFSLITLLCCLLLFVVVLSCSCLDTKCHCVWTILSTDTMSTRRCINLFPSSRDNTAFLRKLLQWLNGVVMCIVRSLLVVYFILIWWFNFKINQACIQYILDVFFLKFLHAFDS